MAAYEELILRLKADPQVWLITGVAGFIGSNLLEALLKYDQRVVGLDSFITGHRRNLFEVQQVVSKTQWEKFRFIEGDICDVDTCYLACDGVDFVLHQAALGSVPRSIKDPINTNRNNVDGFLNMLIAARDSNVKRFVYAASSSTYGDNSDLPKVEANIGRPLSPYAVTKLINELYAKVFDEVYDFKSIGLRYFNVFGRRQDPNGSYAAVIPRWIAAMIKNEAIFINGDGQTSRDFCFIDNAIQANLLAAFASDELAAGEVYNVAVGEQTSLNELFSHLKDVFLEHVPDSMVAEPVYRDFREGDVRHSLANIERAKRLFGYQPTHSVVQGLKETMDWYVQNLMGKTV